MRQQRGDHAPLRRPLLRPRGLSTPAPVVLRHRTLQPHPDQRQNLPVGDPPFQQSPQPVVVDGVEVTGKVRVSNRNAGSCLALRPSFQRRRETFSGTPGSGSNPSGSLSVAETF